MLLAQHGFPQGKNRQRSFISQCTKIPVAQMGENGTSCRTFFDASPLLLSSAIVRVVKCSLIPKIRSCRRWSCGTKPWAILCVRCWCGRVVLQQKFALALRRQTLSPLEDVQLPAGFARQYAGLSLSLLYPFPLLPVLPRCDGASASTDSFWASFPVLSEAQAGQLFVSSPLRLGEVLPRI